MLKEMLNNAVETTLNTASVAFSCVGATVDTICDEEVKEAWKVKRHDIKEISKKQNKELMTLYKEYKTKVAKVNKTAKNAKKVVKDQFSATVKYRFSEHLQERRAAKAEKKKKAKKATVIA